MRYILRVCLLYIPFPVLKYSEAMKPCSHIDDIHVKGDVLQQERVARTCFLSLISFMTVLWLGWKDEARLKLVNVMRRGCIVCLNWFCIVLPVQRFYNQSRFERDGPYLVSVLMILFKRMQKYNKNISRIQLGLHNELKRNCNFHWLRHQ